MPVVLRGFGDVGKKRGFIDGSVKGDGRTDGPTCVDVSELTWTFAKMSGTGYREERDFFFFC
jgi:hypothetical protein